MGKTLDVARDRAFDQTQTVLPAEVSRGVYIQNVPSLAALKLMHLMIATAGGAMADEVQHQFRLSDIRQIEGMRHHDRASLTPLFTELSTTVLIHDDPERKRVTIGGLLDEAVVDYRHEVSGDLLVSWWFGRTFRRMAAESDHWAILDRQTVFHLGSKYSVLLFQHIASLVNLDHVVAKTFTVPELRAVLGIPEGKLERFSNLNQRVIQPAISEINEHSRLTLTATPNKIGRTVASVTIAWKKKPQDQKAGTRRELERREAQQDGSAAPAFPENGSIRWTPWEALTREHAPKPTPDMGLIADRFRDFCAERGLPLTSAGIEKTFVAWVSKFRVG